MNGDDIEELDDRGARDDAGYVEELDSFDQDDDDEGEPDVDEDYDDEDDFLDDATDEDIDLVVAAYREDGEPVVVPLVNDLANDLDELITQLRRLPGDSGSVGAVSIAAEFFVLVRVRGRNVEVLLSDAMAAHDWPIARDVADFLGVEPPEDDDDDDDEPDYMGDIGIFADLGLREMDLESIIEDSEEGSDEAIAEVFEQLKFGTQFRRALKQGALKQGGTR